MTFFGILNINTHIQIISLSLKMYIYVKKKRKYILKQVQGMNNKLPQLNK